MFSKWFRSIIGILLILNCVSCLDIVELEPPSGEAQGLVIQGRLIKGDGQSEVFVNVSSLFDFTAQSRRPVSVRSVQVLHENGSELDVPEISQGNYRLYVDNKDANFPIELDRQFQIRVESFDGQTILSDPEPLVPTPKIRKMRLDSIIIESEVVTDVTREKKAFTFFIDTDARAEGRSEYSRLLWNVENTYRLTDNLLNSNPLLSKTCYITSQLEVPTVKTFNANLTNTERLNNQQMAEVVVDTRFAEGYYITIYQQALSEPAFEYWNQVKDVVLRSGNMFESPAGRIPSNLNNLTNPENLIFGYFHANEQDTMRMYVSPETANFPIQLCLLPLQNPILHFDICDDCLSSPNSTLTKPDWWIE